MATLALGNAATVCLILSAFVSRLCKTLVVVEVILFSSAMLLDATCIPFPGDSATVFVFAALLGLVAPHDTVLAFPSDLHHASTVSLAVFQRILGVPIS